MQTNSIIKKISIIALCTAFSMVNKISFADDEFEPGTTCRSPDDPRLSVICGTVKSAVPIADAETRSGVDPNPPLQGVSVYVYECLENSPTCKLGGSINQPFSSSSTDSGGFYNITARKVGNLEQRYLAFVCDSKLAGLYKIPSYKSFELNVPLNCPVNNSYAQPPELLNPASSNLLACQVKPSYSGAPVSFEGVYESNRFQTTFNFDVQIENADSRFKTQGTVLGDIIDFGGNTDGPREGAWYHEDCINKYDGYLETLCYNPLSTSLDEYENTLYSDEDFTSQNFLPNIPPKNSLLFYKDLTVRQDVTNYSQNPTSPAQLLQTIFSNCKGDVNLRYSGEPESDELPNCEIYKQCSNAGSIDDGTAGSQTRNRQYSGGSTKNLANPSILRAEYEANIDDTVGNIAVCKHNGNSVTLAQIQPPWSYCVVGENSCNYVLDKSYYTDEFSYFFGDKGTNMKVGYSFQGESDSYTSAAGTDQGANAVSFEKGNEKEGLPIKGGTYTVDNNPANTRNNGATAAISGIVSADLAKSGDTALSYVLQRPGETLEDKSMYEQGIVSILDAGSNISQYCEISNTNDPNLVIDATNEAGIYKNQNFRGNDDHYYYFGSGGSSADINKKTSTSAIYMTTAAANRAEALKGRHLKDAYDSLLTASSGDGTYQRSGAGLIWGFLGEIWESLIAQRGSKSFGDRYEAGNHYDLSNPERIDSLFAEFGLSEETFEQAFPLPSQAVGGTNWLATDQWGQDACYPWDVTQLGIRGQCLNTDQTTISRTCRVESCKVATKSVSCSCTLDLGGNVVSNCNDSGGITITTQDCGTDLRYQCATKKYNCLEDEDVSNGGSGDERSCVDDLYASDMDSPSCPDSSDERYYPRNGMCGDSESVPLSTGYCEFNQSASASYPACGVQQAGPYQCAGQLEKEDANLRVTQELLNPQETAGFDLSASELINNEYWKKLAHPGTSKAYGSLGFMSTKTSVTEDTNYSLTTNKDVKSSFPGASPEFKFISSHPIYSDIYNRGNAVDYHCNDGTGLGSGTWDCPLLDVPDPEIVDIYSLSVAGSCALNTSSSCVNSLTSAGLSPAFIQIVNAAATKFSVPAASIVTYLASIGSFGRNAYLFSLGGEQSLIDASSPWYGNLANCDETNIGAQGPYDWLSVWFTSVLDNNGNNVRNALDEISHGRGATASRCNFLDATYAAAGNLVAGGAAAGAACGNWSWDMAREPIYSMAYGTTRAGSYGNVPFFSNGGAGQNIWNNCR